MSSGNPYELEVVHYAKGEGHKEEYWHKTFEKYHWKGEWYMLNFKHIELIKAGACEITF